MGFDEVVDLDMEQLMRGAEGIAIVFPEMGPERAEL